MPAPPARSRTSLGPAAVERPANAGWTAVGVLDPTALARVDGAGLVVADVGGGWSLDWWVGADDRWHLPAREPATRQRRIGPGPVLETAVRIPSGDAVQRVWAVRAGGGEALVVEVENDSPVPFALAIALRPYGLDGAGHLRSVALDGSTLLVDGRPAVWLPRPPNEAVAAGGTDVLDAVVAGASLSWPGATGATVTDDGGGVTAAVLYPVPHRMSLRLVVPLVPPGAAPGTARIDPSAVPDHAAVARGWDAVVSAGGRVTFPDPALTDRAGRSRARLLLAAADLPLALASRQAGAGTVTAALAAGGHEAEALRAVATLLEADPAPVADPAAAVEAVGAAALALGLADDRRVEPEATRGLAELVAQLDRRRTRDRAGPALAALASHLARVGRPAAVGSLARRVGPWPDPWAWADLPGSAATPAAAAPAGGPAGAGRPDGAAPAGDDAVAAARAWLVARRSLVREVPGGLDLLPVFASAWRGGGAEVHRLPTLAGRLSFAVRWHGPRPALLWQLDRRPGDPPVLLRCPGLDPAWSSREERGEALLAGAADALGPPPAPGQSFG